NQGGDAAGRLDDPPTGEIAKDAFAPQRQRAHQAADQAGEVVVVTPWRQGEGLEAPDELVVSAQRVARRLRADADERDPQFIAEKAQRVEKSRLFAHRAGLEAVDLVDDQHARLRLAEQAQRY